MLLYFDKRGALKEYWDYDSVARAGTTNFKIITVFEGLEDSLDGIEATIKLYKPDLNESSYDALEMETVSNFVFDQSLISPSISAYFSNGVNYKALVFDFGNFTDGQEEIILLDTAGLWKAIITLVSNKLNVQGEIDFNVQDGIEIDNPTELDLDTIIANITKQLARKVNLNGDIYLRVINGSDISNGILNLSAYNGLPFAQDCILFTRDTHMFYILTNITTGSVSQIDIEVDTLTVNALTNGDITLSLTNIVDKNTAQTIIGTKTFNAIQYYVGEIGDDADNRTIVNKEYVDRKDAQLSTALNAHEDNTSNPHQVTKAQIGLDNVDNTSDENKPLSAAMRTALAEKQNTLVSGSNIKTVANKSILGSGNVALDKNDVGLGSVDNTSDLNKPVSTATQSALDLKSDKSTTYTKSEVDDKDAILQGEINTINGKIPAQASSSNQLADKNFVNNQINSVAAYYITKNAQGDAFSTVAELEAATVFYSGGEVRIPTRNDYCIVRADENHDNSTTRYIYTGAQWEYQYTVNESPFTTDQLAAINSGITSTLVTQIGTNQTNITNLGTSKQDALVSGTNIKTVANNSILGSGNIELVKGDVGLGNVDNTSDLNKPISTATQSALDNKQNTLVSGTNIKTVASKSLVGAGDVTLDKTDVGLGNVDNTSDLNKPISTATQNALNLKAAANNVYTKSEIDVSLSAKQDTLTAGNNISITNNVISATDTTYTAGTGLSLSGTEFSIDTSVVAELSDLNGLYKGASYSVSGDNANLTLTKNDNNTTVLNIPLANTTTAGLMSSSDVNAISTLNQKVAALEEIGVRLLYTASANPTASDILSFVQAQGYTDSTQYYKISVIVNATKHVWYWYDNLNAFVDEGSGTIDKFTNSTLGSIQGSTSLGKVYAENDGTGSLNGYDKLNNNVAAQYDSTSTYAVGDYCIYNGDLYRCTTAIATPESFDSNKWTQVNLSSSKLDKNSAALKVYATNGSGGQTMIYYCKTSTANISNNSIVQRDGIQVKVAAAPVDLEDATSKYYVDTELEKKVDTDTFNYRVNGLANSSDSIRELNYNKISVIGLTGDTSFTLKSAPVPASPNSCIPTYRAIITNNAVSAITITLPVGTTIRTNDSAITISSNTFTMPASTTVELTIFNSGCEVINKSKSYLNKIDIATQVQSGNANPVSSGAVYTELTTNYLRKYPMVNTTTTMATIASTYGAGSYILGDYYVVSDGVETFSFFSLSNYKRYYGFEIDTSINLYTFFQNYEKSDFIYSAAKTYSANQVCLYNGYLVVSLADSNTGNTPSTSADTSYWARVFVNQ